MCMSKHDWLKLDEYLESDCLTAAEEKHMQKLLDRAAKDACPVGTKASESAVETVKNV